jgi:hypothetical protein
VFCNSSATLLDRQALHFSDSIHNSGDRPDISRADFTFCLLAIDWGWSIEETAGRLLQESSKAQENGEPYALRTARNAAAAIESRQGRQR